MKSFLEKSKRALVLLLTGAMIATSVPSTIFAAPLATDEDVIFEEGADAVEALGIVEENVEGSETNDYVEPDNSNSDVELQLNLTAAYSSGGNTTRSRFALANTGDNPAVIDLNQDTAAANINGTFGASKYGRDYSTTKGYVLVDSTQSEGYSFFVKLDEGYDFDLEEGATIDSIIKEMEYYDFSTINHDAYNAAASIEAAKKTVASSQYTVERVSPMLAKVTLSKDLLTAVESGSYYKDYNAAYPDQAEYRFNPQLKITVNQKTKLRTRALDLSKDVTLTSDLEKKSAINIGKHTVIYNASKGANDKSVLFADIDGTNGYITNKAVDAVADMMTVTYTPVTAEASTDKETVAKVAVVADSASATINGKASTPVFANYMQDSDSIMIYSTWANDFVMGYADLKISIDGTKTDTLYKTVTVTPNSYVEGVYKDGTTDDLNGTTFAYASALNFDIKLPSTATGRSIKTVKAVEKNDGTEFTVSVDGSGNANVTVDDDVTITVTTQESVNVSAVAPGVVLYDVDNKIINGSTKIESGTEGYIVKVIPAKGQIIDDVKYTFEGDEAGWKDITSSLTPENTVTIPEKIEGQLDLYVTQKAAGAKKDVEIKNFVDATVIGSQASPIKEGIAHIYSGNDTSNEFDSTDWTITDGVTNGEYYYFTVYTNANYEPIAKYFMGASQAADQYGKFKNATLVKVLNGETHTQFLYRTTEKVGATTAKVELFISARQVTKINAPKNTQIDASFGEYVWVPSDETYSFTLSTKNAKGTITVDKVTCTDDGTDADDLDTELTKSGTVYSIGATSLANAAGINEAVNLFVATTDTVNPSKYTVKFAYASDDSEAPHLVGEIGSQKLTLGYQETSGKLTAEFKATDRIKTPIVSTAGDGKEDKVTTTKDTEGMFQSSYAASDAVGKLIVTLPTAGSDTTVTGNKIGTDTITSTLIQNGTYGEKTVYAGTLDVEVKPRYTDLHLEVDSNYTSKTEPAIMAQANPGTSADNHVALVVIKGTDTRDGKVKTISSGLNSIDWSFDPDNNNTDADDKTYKMGTAVNTAWDSMTSRNSGSTHSIFVRAKDATTASLDVVAKVKMYADSTEETLTLPLTVIAENNYAPFVSYQYATGTETVIGWDYSAPDIIAYASTLGVNLELDAKGQNTLTAKYPLYMRVSGKTGTAVATTADLDAGIKAGTYEATTSGVTYEVIEAEADKAYVEATVTDTGVLTIKGLKKTNSSVNVKLNAYVDGVMVATNDVSVTVVNEKARTSVRLLLDDVSTYTLNDSKTVSTVVQQTLNSGYLSGKVYEIIEPNNNVPVNAMHLAGNGVGSGIVSLQGVIFTRETVGSGFVLPKDTDFDKTKFGKNRVLIGWQGITSLTETAGSIDVSPTANAYYYPGETVTVSSNAIFAPVFADEYAFSETITQAGDYLGQGASLYNGSLGTDSDNDGINDTFTTQWAGVKVDDVTATSGNYKAASIAAGNTLPLAMKLTQRIPYTEELKAKDSSGTQFATLTTKPVYKSGSDLTVTLAGSNSNLASVDTAKGAITVAGDIDAKVAGSDLTVSASWGDFKTYAFPLAITANQKYTVDWTSASPANPTTMLVDQVNKNTLTATLKQNGAVQGNTETTKFKNWAISYKASPEDVVELTPVDGADEIGTESENANIVTVTPLKAGAVTITVSVKDATGLDISSDYALTIEDNGVGLTITDIATNATVTGTEEDPLYAKAYNGTAAVTSKNYSIIGTNTNGITLSNGEGDGYSTASGYIGEYAVDTDGKSITIESDNYNIKDLGTGYILLNYKKNGDESGILFQRKLYVSTYYEVVLAGDDDDWSIVNGDKDLGVGTGKYGIVRVTEANQIDEDTNPDDDVHVYKYTDVDLSGFSAKGAGANAGKVFLGWKINGVALSGTDKVHYTDKITKKMPYSENDGSKTLQSSQYTLVPIFGNNPITKAVVAQTTIKLSNETTGSPALAATTEKVNVKDFSISVTPYDTADTILVVADKTKNNLFTNSATAATAGKIAYKKGNGDYAEATKTSGASEIPFGSNVNSASGYTGGVYVDNTANKRTDNFNIAAITGTTSQRRAGEIAFELKSKESGVVLNTITVFINGYDAIDKVYMEDGQIVKADKRQVNGETWFFDENGAHVDGDAVITKADGSKIIVADGQLVTSGQVTLTGKFAGTYYVKPDGSVATSEIVTVGGKDRLFREDGTMVSYTDADVKDGKITVNNTPYEIAEDGSAKLADVLYNATVTWETNFATKYTKGSGLPTMTYMITYTSANTGKEDKVTGQAAVVTAEGDYSATSTAAEVTFKATASLAGYYVDKAGTTPATDVEISKKYVFKDGGIEGLAGEYTLKDKTFTWSDLGEGGTAPTVSLKVTYTVTQDGTAQADEEQTVSVTPTITAEDETTITYTATYTTIDGQTLTETKKFSKATGKAGEYTYKSHTAFKWGELAKGATAPSVTSVVTYTVTQDGAKQPDEKFTVSATVEVTSTTETRKAFKATITTIDGKEISESKTYNISKITDDTPVSGGMEGLVVEGLQESYDYMGAAIKPSFYLVDYDIEDGVILGKGTDYKVAYVNPKAKDIKDAKEGTGYIKITGMGNYEGKAIQVPFKIVNQLKSADDVTNYATKVTKVEVSESKFTYNGLPQAPATVTVTADGAALKFEYDATTNTYTADSDNTKDVFVFVNNNIDAGATGVYAQGTDGKIVKGKFSIAKFNLKKATAAQIATVVNDGDPVEYSAAKAGATPNVEVTFTASEDATPIALIAGHDFKATYKNNKGVGAGTVDLAGKNNFTGTLKGAGSFTIEALDLSQVDTDAVAVNAAAGMNPAKIGVSFSDSYGNIVTPKNYTVAATGAAGAKLAAGEELTITVTAKGNNTKESFEITGFTVAQDFTKAKINAKALKAAKTVVYTGSPIFLEDLLDAKEANPFENGLIVVTVGGNALTYGTDFEVAGYSDNIKKGTMTVTLRGIEGYTGSKSVKIPILAKKVTTIEAE